MDPRARRRRRAARSASASGMHTITRDTSEEAWAEADRLLEGIDDETIAPGPGRPASSESEGQRGCSPSTSGSARRPGDPPQPVGRRRPGPRRRRHRAGRQPRGGRRPDRGVRRARHRRVRALRPTRTSRRPTGSARACCPVLEKRGLWTNPAPGRRAARRCRSAASGPRHERPRRRRGRQPQATLAHRTRPRCSSPTGWAAPTSWSTSPTTAAELFDWGAPRVTELVEEVASSRRGRRRQPDLQGDLHRAAQGFLDRFPAPGARRRRPRSR